MLQDVREILTKAVQKLNLNPKEIEVEITESRFGDVSSNLAMRLASEAKIAPRQLAEQLVGVIKDDAPSYVCAVEVAGPGFINFTISDERLFRYAALEENIGRILSYKDKIFVVEYSDPNPFKALHAGHLYTTLVGNVIGNLYAAAGAKVYRVNFGGDVGLHVAKAMWGIINHGSSGSMEEAAALNYTQECAKMNEEARAALVASYYVKATSEYETNYEAKEQIIAYNKRIYELHETSDKTSDFAQIYWAWRNWSYDYFKEFYKEIGVKPFDKYYPESETTQLGLKTVKEQLKNGVYEKSDGAVVFNGEKHNLHTRVFINSNGLPTYETKDIGLSLHKWQDYKFDTSIIITGDDIQEYMKVVLKSIEQFNPKLSSRTIHLTHGQVKLEGGKKMSSRQGNVLLALDVLEAAITAATGNSNNREKKLSKKIAYNSVKYAFLKQAIGGDIVYSPVDSVSLNGNSAVYLQYSYARALSVLEKVNLDAEQMSTELEKDERELLRTISYYVDILDDAIKKVAPQSVCQYAFMLCKEFNSFYEKNKVVGSSRQNVRATILKKYTQVMNHIFEILDIEKIDRI